MSPCRSKEPVHFQNVYEVFEISGICSVKVVSSVPSYCILSIMYCPYLESVTPFMLGHTVMNYILYVMPLRNVYQNVLLDSGIAHAGSDGARRRTGGVVKGKDANGVGSQSSCIHTPHSSTASS